MFRGVNLKKIIANATIAESGESQTSQRPVLNLMGFLTSDEFFTIGFDKKGGILGRTTGVTVPDNTISRTHCKLSRIKNRWFVQDLGSTNGTYVNGSQIRRTMTRYGLVDGDVLKVGSFCFYVSISSLDNSFDGIKKQVQSQLESQETPELRRLAANMHSVADESLVEEKLEGMDSTKAFLLGARLLQRFFTEVAHETGTCHKFRDIASLLESAANTRHHLRFLEKLYKAAEYEPDLMHLYNFQKENLKERLFEQVKREGRILFPGGWIGHQIPCKFTQIELTTCNAGRGSRKYPVNPSSPREVAVVQDHLFDDIRQIPELLDLFIDLKCKKHKSTHDAESAFFNAIDGLHIHRICRARPTFKLPMLAGNCPWRNQMEFIEDEMETWEFRIFQMWARKIVRSEVISRADTQSDPLLKQIQPRYPFFF
jgi:hypothetical protein